MEGLHCWSNIPANEEAQYLRYLHRHLFHIKVIIDVTHNNRDIEFLSLKHAVDHYLLNLFPKTINNVPDMGSMSCEMVAEALLKYFDADYVEVSEDGENGAIVRKDFNYNV